MEGVLVRAAELEKEHVNEVRERAVHVADVAVVAVSGEDRPGHVLKNALVTPEGDQRGPSGRVPHPVERRQRDHERRQEHTQRALEAEIEPFSAFLRGHGGRAEPKPVRGADGGALFPPMPSGSKPRRPYLNT